MPTAAAQWQWLFTDARHAVYICLQCRGKESCGHSLKETDVQEGQALDVIAAWQLIVEQLFFQFVAIASGAAHVRISAWPAHQTTSHHKLLYSICVYVQTTWVKKCHCSL